jgi:hypothetical protein
MGQFRQSLLGNTDADHRIQSQNPEIRQVVPGQSFAGEMGMDATEPSEAPAPRPQSAPIGQFDGPGVADHHVLYVAAPIRENSDLAPDLAADLGELASEFLAEEPIGRKPSREHPLQQLHLASFQPAGISKDLNGRLRGWGRGGFREK